MCCGNKFCCSETKNAFVWSQKHFCFPDTNFASETFFCPSLATSGNLTRNIVSATMFPSSARPLNAAFREKTSLIKTLAGKSDYRDPGNVCRNGRKKSRAKSGREGDFFVPSRLTAPGSPRTREIESSCASSNIVSIEHYYMALSHKVWELPNSRIWLAETDIDRGLDFPI